MNEGQKLEPQRLRPGPLPANRSTSALAMICGFNFPRKCTISR